MAHFPSGGLSLAYDDFGKAGDPRPLILVHGFSSNRVENWRRFGWYDAIERKGLRGIAFDHRGHGESDKPHDPALYGRKILAGDILALMDHLNLERADLFGYSMGAYAALEAAISAPGRFRNLILGGVGARMFEPREMSFTMADAMKAASADDIPEPMLRSFRQFAEEQGEDLAALAACAGSANAMRDPDSLALIRAATLVVAGQRDQLAGSPQGLADLIPGAKAVTLPGCDHFSAIPHGMLKATVFDFLDGWLD